MGHSVDEFFVTLEKDSAEGKTLPNWYVSIHLSSVVDKFMFDV